MTPICIKHNIEIRQDLEGICELCFYDLSVLSTQNMGIPDYYYCGYCGNKCNKEEIIEHATNKICIIQLVENGEN